MLLLPGQGAQRERMAAGLYRVEPVFTREMDLVLGALGPDGARVRAAWLGPGPQQDLEDASIAQPLLFAVGYALGRTVLAGLDRPAAGSGPLGPLPLTLVGHSVGELAAAALAGVFDPEDLGALLRARADVLREDGAGAMLAVAEDPERAGALAGSGVWIAAVNGPRRTVVAGRRPEVEQAAGRLRAAGVTVRALRSSHAFHTPLLEQAARRFGAAVSDLVLRPPRAPLWSGRTSLPVRPAQAADPHFWAGQLALPVRYWPAVRALLDRDGHRPGLLLLDASPDRSLSAVLRGHPAVRSGASAVVPLLPAGQGGGGADRIQLGYARELIRAEARPAGAGPEAQAAASSLLT